MSAGGYGRGEGFDWENMGTDYTPVPGEKYHLKAIYKAWADISKLFGGVSEGNVETAIDNAKTARDKIREEYEIGFYNGFVYSPSGAPTMTRSQAFINYLEFIKQDLENVPVCDSKEKLTELLEDMEEYGLRRSVRNISNLYKVSSDLQGQFPDDNNARLVANWADDLRMALSYTTEDRVANYLIDELDRYVVYFEVIYPYLKSEHDRLENLGLTDSAINYLLRDLEITFWGSQFRVVQKEGVAVVHGYFPDIDVDSNRFDRIVSVYAHTAHGWNGLESEAEFLEELGNNIRFLKIGGRMYAGPVNYGLLNANREDVRAVSRGHYSKLADALDDLAGEGKIRFRLIHPLNHPLLSKDFLESGWNESEFLRCNGFVQGIVVERLAE